MKSILKTVSLSMFFVTLNTSCKRAFNESETPGSIVTDSKGKKQCWGPRFSEPGLIGSCKATDVSGGEYSVWISSSGLNDYGNPKFDASVSYKGPIDKESGKRSDNSMSIGDYDSQVFYQCKSDSCDFHIRGRNGRNDEQLSFISFDLENDNYVPSRMIITSSGDDFLKLNKGIKSGQEFDCKKGAPLEKLKIVPALKCVDRNSSQVRFYVLVSKLDGKWYSIKSGWERPDIDGKYHSYKSASYGLITEVEEGDSISQLKLGADAFGYEIDSRSETNVYRRGQGGIRFRTYPHGIPKLAGDFRDDTSGSINSQVKEYEDGMACEEVTE